MTEINENSITPNVNIQPADQTLPPNTESSESLKNRTEDAGLSALGSSSHDVSLSNLKEREVTFKDLSSSEKMSDVHDVAQSTLSGINQLLRSGEKISKDDLNKIVNFLQSGGNISEEDLGKVVEVAAEFADANVIRALLSDGRTISQTSLKVVIDAFIYSIRAALDYGKSFNVNQTAEVFHALIDNNTISFQNVREQIFQFAYHYKQVDLLEKILSHGEDAISERLFDRCFYFPQFKDADDVKIMKLILNSKSISQPHLDEIHENILNSFNTDYRYTYNPLSVDILYLFLDKKTISSTNLEAAIRSIVSAIQNSHLPMIACEALITLLFEVSRDESTLSSHIKQEVIMFAASFGKLNVLERFTIPQTDLDLYARQILSFKNDENEFYTHDRMAASLCALASAGRKFSQHVQSEGILFAASGGQLTLLENLLNQGAIHSTVRDSAITQASGDQQEAIRAMLSMARVDDSIGDNLDDGFIPSSEDTMQINLSDIKAHSGEYLSSICQKGLPHRIYLTDHPQVIDLGGVTKQFIGSLSEALIGRLSLTDEGLPRSDKDNFALMKQMGTYFSLLYEANKDRTDKLLTGSVFNPLFFALVKLTIANDAAGDPEKQDCLLKEGAQLLKPHVPSYAFCFDCILNPSPENKAKYIQMNREFELDLDEDPIKGSEAIIRSFLNPAQAFSEGLTPMLKKAISSTDPKTLSLSIQGEAVSSDSLIRALHVKSGTPCTHLLETQLGYIKEKIRSSDQEWQKRFLKAATGKTSVSPEMKIELKNTWREGATFEFHTCFNSLDLPNCDMGKEDFLAALDIAIELETYNIA